MSVESVNTLILGAGITGLSVAYHLSSKDYVILEKSNKAGGLAGSTLKNGYTFDSTGHYLHLRDPYATALIKRLLQGNLKEHKRSAWIYQAGRYIPYPYQANLFHAFPCIAKDCIDGMKRLQNSPSIPFKPANFLEWVLVNFGEGFYKHFFRPYNEKLFNTSLEQLTTDWMGMFIPKPSFEEIEKGSTCNYEKSYGYNVSFYYPETGGIQALTDAMVADRRITVRTNCTVVHVNLAGKYVVYRERIYPDDENRLATTPKRVYYHRLVNTLPLPTFAGLIEDIGQYDKQLKDSLKFTTVYNLNLAIDRPNIDQGRHWVYYPEAKYQFYRIGFCNSVNPVAGPEGTSSISVEVSVPNNRSLEDYNVNCGLGVKVGLIDCGVLKETDDIIEECPIVISPAYVLYDHNRNQTVEELTYRLNKENIYLAGRFGKWEYSFVERNILDGKEVAERIDGEGASGITKKMLQL